MAIIQISKIQQRSGNLVDLPQLDEGEMGWASDEKRLFIGKTVPNENIEVLTTYSNINMSQVTGTDGTDFSLNNPSNGEVLGIQTVGNTAYIVNKGGTSISSPGGLINLGNVSNVKIGGGALGYILETDGLGNLSWTAKGTLTANILALSNATPIVMTVANTTPYVNSMKVTISGVQGTGNTIVNSLDFFVKVGNDFPTSGNVTLYTDASLSTAAVGTGLSTTPNTGIATTSLSGAGTAVAAGSNGAVQFNSGSLLGGDSDFTYNNLTNVLTVGNINVSEISATSTITGSRFISNVPVGTAPLTVTSTTKVANLNVDLLDGYDTSISNTASTIPVRDANGNIYATRLIGNVEGGASLSVAKTGDSMTGNITWTNANLGLIWSANTDGASIKFYNTGDSDLDSRLEFNTIDNNNEYFRWTHTPSGGSTYESMKLVPNGTGAAVLTVSGNIIGSNANLGNAVRANYFIGDGSFLTGLADGTSIVNGTSNVSIPVSNGNVGISANGTANVLVVASTGVTANGNLTTRVITTGSNVTTGNITGNWLLTAGSQLEATYADLAEYYEADQEYEPGTVLEFGGEKEVTLAQDESARVAGIVSTDPAYVMNAGCKGIAVAIALQGRVPVKVRGNIKKGDMLVSAGNGFARPTYNPKLGTIIGKSLENFDGIEGIIEIAVGRL